MNNQNNCTNYREDIAALVLGMLEPEEVEKLQKHFETCKDCKSLYEAMLNEEDNLRSGFDEIAQKGETIQNSLIEKFDNDKKAATYTPKTVKLTWYKIIRNPLIKFAAAAVIIIFILFSRNPKNIIWADLLSAYEKMECAHIEIWDITSDKEKSKAAEIWMKRPDMFRDDSSVSSTINNGTEKLEINKDTKTAQFLDSNENNEQAHYMFAFIDMLNGTNLDFENDLPILSRVPELCTKEQLVYDGKYKRVSGVSRSTAQYRIWVDAKTLLFHRMIGYEMSENLSIKPTTEYVFDYDEIQDEFFALNVPDGYTLLPPPKQTIFRGKVLGLDNQPVSGAEVYIVGGSSNMTGITDVNGIFIAKKKTNFGGKFEFPIIVRAFRKSVPGEVAWTIIQNPEDTKKLALNIPDGGNIDVVVDPNSPLTKKCIGASGINLKMQPALKISGKVTDLQGSGLDKAVVTLQNIRLKYTDNTNVSGGVTWIKASVVTENNGEYLLGSLPDFPEGFSLELIASAENYIKSNESKIILTGALQEKGPDFELLKGGVTIKGYVKNTDGDFLPCYPIWHSVNGERIGTVTSLHQDGGQGTYAITGKKGEFELINCPAMEGLAITASGVSKSTFWDMYMRNWELEREFEYYDEKTVEVGYEQGKNEYTVEIILEKASTIVELEVKGFDGQPVDNAEVRLGAFSNQSNPFKAVTDTTGKCVFNKIPWEKQWHLTVVPKDDSNYNMLINAILDFSNNIKKYKIEIVLQNKYEHEPSLKQVNIINLEN